MPRNTAFESNLLEGSGSSATIPAKILNESRYFDRSILGSKIVLACCRVVLDKS